MSITQNPEAELMEKIRSLPPDKITVLKDFSEETVRAVSLQLIRVGKRHVQSPDFGNINNSDATEFDITRRSP